MKFHKKDVKRLQIYSVKKGDYYLDYSYKINMMQNTLQINRNKSNLSFSIFLCLGIVIYIYKIYTVYISEYIFKVALPTLTMCLYTFPQVIFTNLVISYATLK